PFFVNMQSHLLFGVSLSNRSQWHEASCAPAQVRAGQGPCVTTGDDIAAMCSSIGATRARHFVAELRETGACRTHGNQSKRRIRDRAGQQRLARSERHGRDLHDDLVEQIVVVELTDQVTATHDPDVLPLCRPYHLLVHWAHTAARVPVARTRHSRQGARAEYPRRLTVRPRSLAGTAIQMTEQPLVCRRAHRERTDLANEIGIAGLLGIAQAVEPLDRVVLGCDVAVQTRRRVVLCLHEQVYHSNPDMRYRTTLARPYSSRSTAHTCDRLDCTIATFAGNSTVPS